MPNASLVNDMPNITGNFSDEVYEHHENIYERIFLEIFTLVGVLCVIANILLSFVIVKYKRMREDSTNRIFLQLNILQAIYLFATPFTVRLGMAFLHMSSVHLTVFCITYQIEFNLMFGIVWFMLLMVCDWYIKIYHKNVYVKFCRIYKFFLLVMYLLIVLACSMTIQSCFKNIMVLLVYLVMLGCAGLLVIFLFVMNIVHAFKKRRIVINHRRGTFGLAIANIWFLCWSPIVLSSLLVLVRVYINGPLSVIFLFSLGHSSPIFNLIYLYIYDDDYHIFLSSVLRCKCSDYRNESLDNRTVRYNDSNGVEIPENVC